MKRSSSSNQPSSIVPKGNFVANIKTLQGCLNLEFNATKNGHLGLAIAARHQYVELAASAEQSESAVERAGYECLAACELAKLRKHKRNTPCTRTRSMIKRNGMIKTIESIVGRPNQSAGYDILEEMGLLEFTFERVVVKFESLFTPKTVCRALSRVQHLKQT